MIARLLGDKGVREYIQAGKLINKNGNIAQLHLVGSRDSNPNCLSQDEIDEWENIDWLTWYNKTSDVRPFIKNSHVYVLPSYREGTPRTVLEAMSMGRPIITTDVPGCRETVVDGSNGYLVTARNIKELKSAMMKFIESPDLLSDMSKQSRKIAEQKYDVKKVNEDMMNALALNQNDE